MNYHQQCQHYPGAPLTSSGLMLRGCCTALLTLLFLLTTSATNAADNVALPALMPLPENVPSAEVFELRELLTSSDYEQLHQKLDEYQRHYENGTGSEISVEIAYSAFSGGDPAYLSHLDEWLEAFPDHYTGYMARAIYWASLGWIKRGEDYASATGEPQFAGMREAHASATVDAGQVLELKPAVDPRLCHVDLHCLIEYQAIRV